MTNLEKIQLCQKIVDRIQEDSKRPACYLEFSKESFGIADSHLGGVPYVPRDGEIPADEDGSQLWLCAQINFAQMPHMDGFPDLEPDQSARYGALDLIEALPQDVGGDQHEEGRR